MDGSTGNVRGLKRSQSAERLAQHAETAASCVRGRSLSASGEGTEGLLPQSSQEQGQHTMLFDRYLTQSDVLNPEGDERKNYDEAARIIDNANIYDFVDKFKYHPKDLIIEKEPDGTYEYTSDNFTNAQKSIKSFIEQLGDPESNASELPDVIDAICENVTALNLLAHAYQGNAEIFNDIFLNLPIEMVEQLLAGLQLNIADANEYPLVQYLRDQYPVARETMLNEQNQNRREAVLNTVAKALGDMTVAMFEKAENAENGSDTLLIDKKKTGIYGFRSETSDSLNTAKTKVTEFLNLVSNREFSDAELNDAWQNICNDPIALGVIKTLYVDNDIVDSPVEAALLSIFQELPTQFIKTLEKAFSRNIKTLKSESLRSELTTIIQASKTVPQPPAESATPARARSILEPVAPSVTEPTAVPDISRSSSFKELHQAPLVDEEDPDVAAAAARQAAGKSEARTPVVTLPAAREVPAEASAPVSTPVEGQYFPVNAERINTALGVMRFDNEAQEPAFRDFLNNISRMSDAQVLKDENGNLIFQQTTGEGEDQTVTKTDEINFVIEVINNLEDINYLAPSLGKLFLQDRKAFAEFLASLPNSVVVVVWNAMNQSPDNDPLSPEDKESLTRELGMSLGKAFGTTAEIQRLGSMLADYKLAITALSNACNAVALERNAALDQVEQLDSAAVIALKKFSETRGPAATADTMNAWIGLLRDEQEAVLEAEEQSEAGEGGAAQDENKVATPISDAIVTLSQTRPEVEDLEEGELAPTALETYMEGLPASYWTPLADIEGMHDVVVAKLKDSDPEEWLTALPLDKAIELTRDIVPDVLKLINDENRPNILKRFVSSLWSWVTWSSTPNYAATKQGQIIAAMVTQFSEEAQLQALCHDGHLGKLLDTLSQSEFDEVFQDTVVLDQPNITLLAQHSKRASSALRQLIMDAEDPEDTNNIDGDIRHNLANLSPSLAITYFAHIDIPTLRDIKQQPNTGDYAKLLLENVDESENPADVEALLGLPEFLSQFENNVKQDEAYLTDIIAERSQDLQIALAAHSPTFRKTFVAGMLTVLEANLENPQQLTDDAAIAAETDPFKRIFSKLTADDFFALAQLDPKCSMLILGQAAQKRGFFGKIYDVGASIFSFLEAGEDAIEDGNLEPDCILERLFIQDVTAQDGYSIRTSFDAAIRAHLKKEIPLPALERYFRLVIQDENYGLDQFVTQFAKDIFEELAVSLEDPEIAEKYNYDPENQQVLAQLRSSLCAKLVENFNLFKELISVSTAQKIGLMLEGELDIDIPTREEGIENAYSKLNPNQMMGMIRSFLLSPEDTRWFRTWRSELPLSEQSQMHAGYLADYLESFMQEKIEGTTQSRLQHLFSTNEAAAQNMTFLHQQLNEIRSGTYKRIEGPQAVRNQTDISILNFNPEADTQAIAEAKHFSGESTWNRTRRGILSNWQSQITNPNGPQMTPWAFNKMLKAMLQVLGESTLEEGEYTSEGDVYETRFITPSDIVQSIGGIIDAASEANLITPSAYELILKHIQEGRITGTPGVKTMGRVLGGQLAIGNTNIPATVYNVFNVAVSTTAA